MKNISSALSYVLFVGCAIATIYIRLKNPELTETQLVIQYWPVYLVILVLVIAFAMLSVRGKNQTPPNTKKIL